MLSLMTPWYLRWLLKPFIDAGATAADVRHALDLARIARSPDRRDEQCLRAVLRITRLYLVPLWLGTYAGWDARSAEKCGSEPQIAAVSSTSLPGTPGNLYRFDGWEKVRTSKGPMGGSRQKPSAANAMADGARGLWVYSYPEPAPRKGGRPRQPDTEERVRRTRGLLAEGKDTMQIARLLGVDGSTVCYYKRRLAEPGELPEMSAR